MFKSAWTSFCISFVTGSPGAGKSYTLIKDLHARLSEHRGKVITNLPIEVEAFSKSVARSTGRKPQEIADQLVLIPQELLNHWKDGNSTPGQLAELPQLLGLDSIEGALFILDECHLFCPKTEPMRQKMWQKWLGEVRHEGWAGVFFVSQDVSKVGQAIISHAELRFELTKADKLKDPLFGIQLHYWWALIASFTRQHLAFINVVEYRRKAGKLQAESGTLVRLEPEYFGLYRSLEAAGGGTKGGALNSKKLEHERRPVAWFGKDEEGRRLAPVWLWFAWINFPNLASRFVLLGLVLWMTFGGGIVWGINTWLATTSKMASANSPNAPAGAGQPGVEPGPVGGGQSASPQKPEASEPQPIEAFSEASAARFAELLGKLDAPERAEVLANVQAMRAAFESERAALKVAEFEEHQRKEKLKESVKVVAIDRSRVWLSDGSELGEGEPIHGGVFDGLHVAEINRGRRLVRFNDGYTVSMSRPNGMRKPEGVSDSEPDPKPAADSSRAGEAGIPGPVRNRPIGRSAEGGEG